jgi:sulfur carrier protein
MNTMANTIEAETGAAIDTAIGIDTEIEIELNGAPHRVAAGCTLHDLIGALALTGQALALAVNREIAPRNTWPQRVLSAQDRVDIVRAIGGG